MCVLNIRDNINSCLSAILTVDLSEVGIGQKKDISKHKWTITFLNRVGWKVVLNHVAMNPYYNVKKGEVMFMLRAERTISYCRYSLKESF